jgi:hypothetical protein
MRHGQQFKLHVRVTRQERCEFGFYLLVNGSRLRFGTKAQALRAVQSILDLQRFQIVSVTEYSRRKSVKKRIAKATI